MATIKFETGQTVNFEGNPTPADIEEVAKSLKIQKTPETPVSQETSQKTGIKMTGNPIMDSIGNFGLGVGSQIGKFALGTAQLPIKAATALGKATGTNTAPTEAISNFLEKAKGNVYEKPMEENLATIPGQVGQIVGGIAPYFAGGGAVNSASKGLSLIPRVLARTAGDVGISQMQTGGNTNVGLATGLPSLAANLLPGGTKTQRFVQGALPGYLGDVTMGLTGQRGEDRTGGSAFIPGLGTAIGAGFGATQIKNYSAKEIKNAVDDMEQNWTDIFNGWVAPRKLQLKNQKTTGYKNVAGTEGKTGARILAETGIIPNTADGKFATISQADDLRTKVTPLQEANKAGLAEVESSVKPLSLEKMRRTSIANVKSQGLTAKTEETMVNKINESFDAYSRKYGNEIPITNLDDIKSAEWGETKFDTAVPQLERDTHYAIAKSMQKQIEKVASEAGHTEVAQLNRHIGDILEGAKMLESINGRVLLGGRMTKNFNRIAGMITGGMAGGPFGSLMGAFAGDELTTILQKYSIASPFTKSILKNLQETDPKAFTKTMEWLAKQKFDREGRLMLPEKGYQPPTEFEQGAKNVNRSDTEPTLKMPGQVAEKKPLMLAPGTKGTIPGETIKLPPEGGYPKPIIGEGYSQGNSLPENNVRQDIQKSQQTAKNSNNPISTSVIPQLKKKSSEVGELPLLKEFAKKYNNPQELEHALSYKKPIDVLEEIQNYRKSGGKDIDLENLFPKVNETKSVIPNKQGGFIGETRHPIFTEAKKYKTPQEFENAMNILYKDSWMGKKSPNADAMKEMFKGYAFHGTNAVDKIKTTGFNKQQYWNSGTYFADTPERAIDYKNQNRSMGGKSQGVFAVDLNKLKIKNLKYDDFRAVNKADDRMESVVAQLKKQGYDGIKAPEVGETLIWNNEKIKNPKTLTDIWHDREKGVTPMAILLAGSGIGLGLASLMPKKAGAQENEKPDMHPDTIKKYREGIAGNEATKTGDSYTFHKFSGSKALGDDNGRYQITTAEINERSKQFLGRKVSVEEFLASPKLQDQYMDAKIKYLLSNGWNVPQMLAAHRGGFSNFSKRQHIYEERKPYVDNIMNSFKKQNEPI